MKKFTPHVVALVLLLSTPLAAQVPDSFLEKIGAGSTPLEALLASAPTTPQARLDAWQRAILEFTETHAALTEGKLLVLADASNLVQPGTFADDFADVQFLRTSLDAIRKVLPTDELISLLGNFEGLQSWLYKNGLIEGFVVKAVAGETTCDCDSNWDCTGVACQAISCTSGSGSRSWGVCGGSGGGSPE